jgi:hypothetical protein
MIRMHSIHVVVGLGLAFSLMQNASVTKAVDLVGDYRLTDGNFDNSAVGPGALGSMTFTQTGGTLGFGPSGWSWSDATGPSGSGLNLSGITGGLASAYSVGVTAFFSETDGFRKLIDFNDLTTDIGMYVFADQFQFYNIAAAAGTSAPFDAFTIVLTRDASKNVNVYLNGNSTPIISFVDSSDEAVAASGVLRFFQDDTAIANEFSTGGSASLIRVWDGALSSGEIAGAMTVPEPSTYLLTAIAAGTISLGRRRRNVRRI